MPDVNRPGSNVLLPLMAAAVVFGAGCTPPASGDTIATFDGEELTSDQLVELVDAFGGGDPNDAAAARQSISLWVQVEAVKTALDAADVSIDDQAIDDATARLSQSDPGFAERSDETRDYLVQAQASFTAIDAVPTPPEEEIREFYDQGIDASGVACTAHILVESRAEADEIVAELADGADFATLATERSTDPGSAAQGGVLACTSSADFGATFVREYVDAALDAEIGVPTDPVESDFGFHVILVRPLDEVREELSGFFDSPNFLIAQTIARADVHVNPRYGTLLGGEVVPLT